MKISISTENIPIIRDCTTNLMIVCLQQKSSRIAHQNPIKLFLSRISRSMKKRVKQILSHVLLLLFISYYSSITLFWHSHHLGNTTIVHSHPFNNTQHSHTAPQYDLIKVLTETAGFIGLGGFIIAAALKVKSHEFAPKAVSEAFQYDSVVWYRRGPPAYLFA